MSYQALIPFSMLLIYFIRFKRKIQWSNPAIFIISIYLISAFCSALFSIDDLAHIVLPDIQVGSINSLYYFVFGSLIIITLHPLRKIKGLSINLSDLYINRQIVGFTYFFCAVAWIAFIYLVPFAIATTKIGALDVRANLNTEGEGILPHTWLTTLSVSIANFYAIYVLLLFLFLERKTNFIVKVSLFIGSILYFVSSLCFAARDGVVFTIFAYIFFYLLFKRSISRKNSKKIKYAFIIMGIVLIPFIAKFTIQRFSSKQDNRIIQGTLGYIGEQPFIFGETIQQQKTFYGGSLRFPLFQQMIGGYHEVARTEVYQWSFGTFLTDFYCINGWFSLIVFIIIFYLFFNYALDKRREKGLFSFLIILCFYFQFMTQGVFYFRLGMRGGNLYIIEIAILYIISKVIPTKYYKQRKWQPKSLLSQL